MNGCGLDLAIVILGRSKNSRKLLKCIFTKEESSEFRQPQDRGHNPCEGTERKVEIGVRIQLTHTHVFR